ncbi:Kallikrein 1-related peptidase [Seminavis robusta]|uniref:Kallikrein 1-related peptidase n=1 Tax=Seminavis robusta TaxID=568900 RepID=A0A9N8HKH8_9STRA|nr:Kallikrein 1-related peptidase [Seminavis robusta]|eukprot:Sro945_g223060.1 Kallikrein 1-related peptidase (519) ;mRNA; f:3761-5384
MSKNRGFLLIVLSFVLAHAQNVAPEPSARVLRGSNEESAAIDNKNDKNYNASDTITRNIITLRDLVVDRDALNELKRQGRDPYEIDFILHPPGHEANHMEDYPFFAHWMQQGCGASVIHHDILLSAAHCVREARDPNRIRQMRLMSKYRGGLGGYGQNISENGITRFIAHYEIHPDFNSDKPGAPSHDYLIIKLDRSVLVEQDDQGKYYPTGVKAVKLNTDIDNPMDGQEVLAVGFGSVTPKKPSPDSAVLMDAVLETLPNELCVKHYGERKMHEDVMICVGTLNGTRDTCHGDSGGPIVDANSVQVGIVSWGGKECADARHAGVAARVDNRVATPWIKEQICRLSAFPPKSCHAHDTKSFNHRLPSLAEMSGSGSPLFSIKVTVAHDLAPEETSWSFAHLESFTLLHWQPYEQIPMPYVAVQRVFSNLVAGNYTFAISDQDGVCCGYGPGFMEITKEGTGEVLWEHNGVFQYFLSVTLELDSTGSVVSVHESQEWLNPVRTLFASRHENNPNERRHA